MTSLIRDNKIDPDIEVMMIQRQTISTYMNTIQDDISDTSRECDRIRKLLDELERLCRVHFKQQEEFLGELDFPPAAQQKTLHDLFLKDIALLKTDNDQCHSPDVILDFMKLRLEYIRTTNSETMMLCDFITSRTGNMGSVA
jgi:hemerythrin